MLSQIPYFAVPLVIYRDEAPTWNRCLCSQCLLSLMMTVQGVFLSPDVVGIEAVSRA